MRSSAPPGQRGKPARDRRARCGQDRAPERRVGHRCRPPGRGSSARRGSNSRRGSASPASTRCSSRSWTALPELPAVHRDALNVALGFGDGAPPAPRRIECRARAPARIGRSRTVAGDHRRPAMAGPSKRGCPELRRPPPQGQPGRLPRRIADHGEEDFFERGGLPELEVQRLDDAASVQLLDGRFSDLGSTVRERILVEAQGIPLALLELPVALGPGLRASAKALPPALPLGRRLQGLYGSRIAGLPPRTRTLLLLMALDGTGDVRVLEAGGAEKPDLRDLEPAEHGRLAYLDEATHRLAFHHPLMRSAVVELAQPRERRAAHRVLADLWARSAGSPSVASRRGDRRAGRVRGGRARKPRRRGSWPEATPSVVSRR